MSATQQATPPLTKTEALRRAIAALGHKASVPQILEYVREHFGIGATTGSPEPVNPPEPVIEAPASQQGEVAPSKPLTRRGKPKA